MKQIITTTFLCLTILLPLVFTTLTSELFELPKFLILLTGTIIIGSSWLIYALSTRDWTIPQSQESTTKVIHWSIIAILMTQTLTTITSIHPYTSFWGYYSRFHQGLLTTICYTILYFAAVKWFDNQAVHKFITVTIRTSLVIALIAILEHYNISLTCLLLTSLLHISNAELPVSLTTSCWGALTNPLNRSFATIGQPNWLAAYLIPHVYLLISQSITKYSGKTNYGAIAAVTALVAGVLVTGSRSGFTALLISGVMYLVILSRNFPTPRIKATVAPYLVSLLIPIILLGTPFGSIMKKQPEAPIQPETVIADTDVSSGISESGDIRKIVWDGTLKLIKKHPLLGTGPETFAYTYYWERPVAHNYTSEWGLLYNKAHNEYLNMAATTGLVGLAAYLYWHGAAVHVALQPISHSKKTDKTEENTRSSYFPVLGASMTSFAITNFFGFSVIPVYFLTTMVSTLPFTLSNTHISHISDHTRGMFASIIASLILIIIFPVRFFFADIYYNLGKANNSVPFLERAMLLRPEEDLFVSQLAEAYAQKGTLEMYRDKALALSSQTTRHNPYEVNFYRSRTKVYLALAQIDSKYLILARDELAQARTLAPTDPKLAYNLGLLYSRTGDFPQAEKEIKQAIELKKNYQDPYYALTLIYEQTKQEDKIPELLHTAQSNLATYSATLKEKMDKYIPAIDSTTL